MDNSCSDAVVRFECLKLANEYARHFAHTSEEMVARAKAYEDFVQGTASGVTGAMARMEDITGVTDLMRQNSR